MTQSKDDKDKFTMRIQIPIITQFTWYAAITKRPNCYNVPKQLIYRKLECSEKRQAPLANLPLAEKMQSDTESGGLIKPFKAPYLKNW